MATEDTTVTICPYFKIHEGKVDAFKSLCDQFVAKTETEPKCHYYGFSFDGDLVFCREGYEGAAGALAHLENIGPLLQEALKISDLERLELHGLAAELDQMREPMAELNPQYFVLEYGFKR
jgi:quinol monooxygenase YgiN